MKKALFLAMVLSVSLAAFAGDVVTAVFTVNPAMSCGNCENKIKSNLRYEKGVKEILPSVKAQTVVVKYDSGQTCPEKLIQAFKKIGYEATVQNASENKTCVPVQDCGSCGGCCGEKKK